MADVGGLLGAARAVIQMKSQVNSLEPVIAFHHSAPLSGGCWTGYHDWRTDSSGSIEDDLVEFFLDRNEQSEHLLGACGELVNRVIYDCQQFHGGGGYMRGTAHERMARDARIQAIGGGATEVMLEEVAKRSVVV